MVHKIEGVGYACKIGPTRPISLSVESLGESSSTGLSEETAPDLVEMGVFRAGERVGRIPVPNARRLAVQETFTAPVQLLFAVVEKKDVVYGTLFALLQKRGDESEAWKGEGTGGEVSAERELGVPIARARRLGVERRFPASLEHEAQDLFYSLLAGDESLLSDEDLKKLGI